MPIAIDTQTKYGRLTPVSPAGKTASGHPSWNFLCDCGKTKTARVCHVTSGRTTSCGCLHSERVREVSRAQTGITPGARFGRLTAVAEQPRDGTVSSWSFRCDCGTELVLPSMKAKSGHTKSCGCLNRDASRSRWLKHGHYKSREYRSWLGIKARCYNPRSASFQDYGGRGITVCDRWLGPEGFKHFLEDMGDCPSADHSIDRLDNSRGYSPDNCAWRTRVEQMNNRRGNIALTHNGETLTLAQWARKLGIKRATLGARVRMGWDAARTLTTPLTKPAHPEPRRG